MSSIFGRLALDVYQALSNGFTAIDTAAQPKHYREDLVAAGINRAIKDGKNRRSDLYLQTKFTSIHGQDPSRLPYDPKTSLPEQVNASVMSSLRNFTFSSDTEQPYIDTLVLHSPMPSTAETLEVWQTLEQYVPGEIRNLGISNCNLFTLMDLYERATIKPAVVQNRFYSDTKFDIGVRRFCQDKNIVYQSFGTLSANPALLKSPEVRQAVQMLKTSPEAALYCLILSLENIVILNGTTNPKNMRADWQAIDSAKTFAESSPESWQELVSAFKQRIGQVRG